MTNKAEKPKKPKMIFQTVQPGQSMEDVKREMAAKHGIDAEAGATMIDGSNMDPEQIKAMLAGLGMGSEDIDNVLSGKEPKKKPGLFQKIQDKLFD